MSITTTNSSSIFSTKNSHFVKGASDKILL
jgi:hypothetical protein